MNVDWYPDCVHFASVCERLLLSKARICGILKDVICLLGLVKKD